MKWALIAAWQRFREVRHQQRVNGYHGPLSVYAAFWAEKGDWEWVLMGNMRHPGDANVPFMPYGKREPEDTP